MEPCVYILLLYRTITCTAYIVCPHSHGLLPAFVMRKAEEEHGRLLVGLFEGEMLRSLLFVLVRFLSFR